MLLNQDSKKRYPSDKLQIQAKEGVVKYEPVDTDWIPVAKEATATTGGLITFTDTSFDAESVFAIGDRIRLKQDGYANYKYFYVIKKSLNTITVPSTLSSYSTTEDDVTNIAITKKFVTNDTDFGFPPRLRFDPNITSSAGSVSNVDGNLYVALFGRVVVAQGLLTGTLSTTSQYLYVDLPIQISLMDYDALPNNQHIYIIDGGGATPEHAILFKSPPPNTGVHTSIEKLSGNFDSGNFELYYKWEYIYYE